MEVSTSCSSTKHEVEIEFKCTKLDEHYRGTNLNVKKTFHILDFYHGILMITDKKIDESQRCLLILCYIANVDNTTATLYEFSAPEMDPNLRLGESHELHEAKAKLHHFESGENVEEDAVCTHFTYTTDSSNTAKLRNISGIIEISFEACPGQIKKQSLIQGFSNLNQNYIKTYIQKVPKKGNPNSSENVKLICGDVTEVFDKTILCSISDVFDAMFSNPNNMECKNGAVYLEEVDPITIQGFSRLLTSNLVKEEDLNVSMLLFADRYNIQPIFQLCLDHLKKNMTLENFPEIAKASDLITNNSLLQAAAEFASKNLGKFDDNPDVKNFIRANPECFAKVFENMIFKK